MKTNIFFRNKTFQAWVWLVVLLLVWELVARFGLVNPHLLPPFSKVLVNMVTEISAGRLWIQTLNTLQMILVGFVLSLVMASVFAALSMWFPLVESLFNMLNAIMNPLPAVAIMPLIIIWFGINTGAMLAMIVHGVFWALFQHLMDGLRTVVPTYREWGRNIGLSPPRMFTDIMAFAIMPAFLSGARVGWSRSWRNLISAEMIFGMIGNLGGLGFYIYMSRAFANITNVMSGVLIIIIIGILVESLLFTQIEKHTIRRWGMTHE